MNEEELRSIICLIPENEIVGLEDFRKRYINSSGKNVPFHMTLLYNFYLPCETTDNVICELEKIAKSTPKFHFVAKPLSSFPTSNVLYLTPSPVTPLEELTTQLHKSFPEFHKPEYGFPVYHMTIALGNPLRDIEKIIDEYIERFDYKPLQLTAGRIAIYVQRGEQWHHYQSFELGK